MPVKIVSRQPLSFYVAKYNIPLLTNAIVSLVSRIKFDLKYRKYLTSKPPLFEMIEIETFNRCNNDCAFCPVNRNVDPRKPTYMSRELYSKIIDQLAELNFSGTVFLYHNNEPLLDRRLESFISEAIKKLPLARVEIWTNGILLTPERIKSLYDAGLRYLVIDNYNYELKLLPNIERLLESIKDSEIEKSMNIRVWLRYKDAILTNRAGMAPNKKGILKKLANLEKRIIQMRGCEYPFVQFNVNPEGKVHICCNDALYTNIVGDLNKQSISEIWYGEKLQQIRRELIHNGRRHLYPCSECDKL